MKRISRWWYANSTLQRSKVSSFVNGLKHVLVIHIWRGKSFSRTCLKIALWSSEEHLWIYFLTQSTQKTSSKFPLQMIIKPSHKITIFHTDITILLSNKFFMTRKKVQFPSQLCLRCLLIIHTKLIIVGNL
jgi:hypothetical protein